jgi:phospholipase C
MNQSGTIADALTGPSSCGSSAKAMDGIQGRCAYGPRLPLLVVSPYAKKNFVDSTLTDQSSILRFIEYNFRLPQIGGGSFDSIAGPLVNMFDFSDNARNDKLFLHCSTGQPSKQAETCNTY